jgi:AcrR family transcriptional regulator
MGEMRMVAPGVANWVNEPKQLRSRETLDRMLAAGESLLDEGTFADATVAEVVRRAETSVGAFYTRFPDKEALLYALQARAIEDVSETFDELVQLFHEKVDLSLQAALEATIARILFVYRKRRGVIRALAIHARATPQGELQERSRQLNRRVWDGFRAMMMSRIDEITHPDPERAIDLGFTAIAATLRELVIFGAAGLAPESHDDAELARELTRLYLSYLGVAGSGGSA